VPPTLGDRLEHILEAIGAIEQLLDSTTVEAIEGDLIQRMGFERALEIICEASRYVPPTVKAQEKAIDWQRMIDLGNLLRHGYHIIRIEILFDIARNDLPPLKAFVARVLAEERKQ